MMEKNQKDKINKFIYMNDNDKVIKKVKKEKIIKETI